MSEATELRKESRERYQAPNFWLERARESQRFMREFGGSDDWMLYRNYYRGNFGSEYFYNLFYIYIRSIMPSVYYRNPTVINTPMRQFGPDPDPVRIIGARVFDSIDAFLMKRMNFKDVIRDVIFDAICSSQGVVKIGYSSEYGDLGKATDQMLGSDKSFVEHNTDVRNGMPWIARTEPETFCVPFGTRRKRQTPWIIHMILRATEDVRNSPYYKGTKDLAGTHLNLMQEYFQQNQLVNFAENSDWTELHEVYDKRHGTIGTYIPTLPSADGDKDPLWVRDFSADNIMTTLDDDPFENLCFNEDPMFFWGASDFRQLKPVQDEINEVKHQTRAHRRIALLRILYNVGMIDPAEVAKFLDADKPGIGIPVKGDPNGAFAMLTPYIPPDLMSWAREVQEDGRVLTGVGKQQSGVAQGGRKTATEIQTAQMGYDLRVGERRDQVADFISRVMTKVNKIVAKYWSAADALPVVGLDGAVYWVEFNRNVLQGQYTTRVDADELSPTSMALRRQEIMQVMQTLGPNANSDFLFRQLLGLYDWADIPSILPQGGNGQQMPMDAFMSQQTQMSPEARQNGMANAMQALQGAPQNAAVGGSEGEF